MDINIGANVSGAVNGLNQVAGAGTKATTALSKLPNVSNQSTLALSNLSRVAQDAPYGFIGIANNLNPLLESFQRLKQTTGSTGEAFKALGASMMGAGGIGLALGVVSSLLVVFGDKLFGAAAASKESENRLKEYSQALEEAKDKVNDLSSAIQFANSLGAINVKIFGGGDLRDLREQSIAQDDLIASIRGQVAAQIQLNKQISDDTKLSSKDRAQAMEDGFKTLKELQIREQDETNKQRLIYRKIALQKITDQKEADDKARALQEKSSAEYEKWVQGIISRAQKLSSAFKNVIDITPNFSVLDTKGESLQKALGFLNNFDAGNFKLKIYIPRVEITFPPEATKAAGMEFGEMFHTELTNYFSGGTFDPSIILAQQNWAKGEGMRQLGRDLGAEFANALSEAMTGGLEAVGEGIGNVLSGKDFGAGLIDVMSNLLTTLGKILIKYGVIKIGIDKILGPGGILIPGGAMIALGVFAVAAGQAFRNIPGRASGGPVTAGHPYMVGEGGRAEMFIPSTSGRIVPNNALGIGQGGMVVQIAGEFRQRGNDLVATIEQVIRSQNRLG